MSHATPTFSVKSTHKYVNTANEEEDTSFYYSAKKTVSKPRTETESLNREGSAKGISIKTTTTSMEDFY